MKSSILILCFIAFTTAIHAQKPRIEAVGDQEMHIYSFQKGGDSIRFTIFKKRDTVHTTEYYRNGQPERMTWKKDSSYLFDELGRLKIVYYDLAEKSAHKENKRTFYANALPNKWQSFKNGVCLEQTFDKNGRVILTKRTVFAADYTYERSEDRNGVPINATRTDTLSRGDKSKTIAHDTTFFENGRPSKICHKQNRFESLGCQYFTEEGAVSKITLADSFDLISFKNNVECYYGLKNRRGDTIVQPRFDRIERYGNPFWSAYNGESATLLERNGAPMSTPFTNLMSISGANGTYPYTKSSNAGYKPDMQARLGTDYYFTKYFRFVDGGKYGIVNSKMEMVLPPQYFYLTGKYLEDAKYFEFIDRHKDSVARTGFLNRQGKPLFPDRFKGVIYSYFEDYFFLSLTPYIRVSGCTEGESTWRADRTIARYAYDDIEWSENAAVFNQFGVGKADGTIILEPKYQRITHIDDALFLVSVAKSKKDDWGFNTHDGLYNAATKKWLLDTSAYEVTYSNYWRPDFFIVKHLPTKKSGIMDMQGHYILPLSYDDIDVIRGMSNRVVLKKGKQAQIATIKDGKITIQKEKYDHLTPVNFEISSFPSEQLNYFLAQQAGKWGFIDATGKVLKPFIYDYASTLNSYDNRFFLVKNNQAEHYGVSSFPNELGFYPNFGRNEPNPNEVEAFNLVDSTETVFFINNSGKVVIPPQYKQLNNSDNDSWVFLENAQKQKKFVFKATGQLVDFPFSYKIDWANPQSSVMLVHDTTYLSQGVVSTDGKLLMPTHNYSVAIGDIETSTFFVKRDTPLVKRTYDRYGRLEQVRVNTDSLTIEDKDWLMYDKNSKLISDKPFRFPIQFEEGIGIGMKDDAFGLYRTDGTALTIGGVQNFNNIRHGKGSKADFYTLYYNQGMTPQLIVTKLNGDILIESGRYDGISVFYGKYALVSKAGKIGLIDSLGKEIIAPQDLKVFKTHFMDSLDLVNQPAYEKRNKKDPSWSDSFLIQPIDFHYGNSDEHPDSLQLTTAQRVVLWNLMLQKALQMTIKTASDINIARVKIKESADFINESSDSPEDTYTRPKRIVVSDSTIAFASHEIYNDGQTDVAFYNFYHRNNRWNELKINDLLQIQGEKRWAMNELITQKVKALEDEQIDCSNASAFITTVENRWQLTQKGIDFCFDSTENRNEFVIISFTWAELKPFLKIKIF